MAVATLNRKLDTDTADTYLKPPEKTQSLVRQKSKALLMSENLRLFVFTEEFPVVG